jgi:hypothetical protein
VISPAKCAKLFPSQKIRMTEVALLWDVIVLIVTRYCRPRDAVRFSLTCKRLYVLFDCVPYGGCKTTMRLMLTCGVPHCDVAEIWASTQEQMRRNAKRKNLFGGLCGTCGWDHPGTKCPIGKMAHCQDCDRKGPMTLVLNRYAFETQCRMCKTRITFAVKGCAACGKLCTRCHYNLCQYCNEYCYRFGHRCPTMKRCIMCGDFCDRPCRWRTGDAICSEDCLDCLRGMPGTPYHFW